MTPLAFGQINNNGSGGSIVSGTAGQPAVYTGANAVGSSPTISSDVYFASGRPWVDVQAKGAKGDCVTDDTAAIQAAINVAQGHYMDVFFPPPSGGCYIVSPPTNAYIFQLTAGNFRIIGAPSVVLKVKAAGGDFRTWFGPEFVTGISNVAIEGLTFDWNSTNNAPANATQLNTYSRSLWRDGGACDNVSFNHSSFTNVINKNTIYSSCTHVSITNDKWTNVGGGSVFADHSETYLIGDGYVISNNQFISSGENSAVASSAIEVHGTGAILGNYVDGYEGGMNVTGVALVNSTPLIVANNAIRNVYYGIKLQASVYNAHASGLGMSNVVVTGNAINVDQVGWTVDSFSGGAIVGNPKGIWFWSGTSPANLNFQDITIADNIVSFVLESGSAFNAADIADGYGIGIYDTAGTSFCDDCRILNNTVRNSPTAGIRWTINSSTNTEIRGNQVINAGSAWCTALNTPTTGCTANIPANSIYRSGIVMVPTLAPVNCRVTDNVITDNQATSTLAFGMNFFSFPAGSDCVEKNNTVNLTGATTTSLQASIKGNGIFNTTSSNRNVLLFNVASFAAFPAPSAVVSGGTGTSNTYKYTVKDGNGNLTGISAGAVASTAATLNGSNFVTLTCPASTTTQMQTYGNTTPTCVFYRTAAGGTPSTVGALATCAAVAAGATCVDNGLAGDTTIPGTITGTGALATLYTIPIPANTLQPGKGINVDLYWNHVGANTETVQVNYGSCSPALFFSATSTGKLSLHGQLLLPPGDTAHENAINWGGAAGTSSQANCTVDSTAAQNLIVQQNLNAADTITPYGIVVTALQ